MFCRLFIKFCDSFLFAMAALTLFQRCNCTSGDNMVFDYRHEGRNDVVVVVYINEMKLNYRNHSGFWTGVHGRCSEENPFDGNYSGQVVHQIEFHGLQAPNGIPQSLLFKQIGEYVWKATHRNGQSITISLQRPGSRQCEIERPLDSDELQDVVALVDRDPVSDGNAVVDSDGGYILV